MVPILQLAGSPVALAVANLRLSDNLLPHPLSYLATGNISNCLLGDVDSVEAKATGQRSESRSGLRTSFAQS